MTKKSRGLPTIVADNVLDELGIKTIEELRFLELIAFQRGAVVRKARIDTAEARLTVGKKRSIITISTSINNKRRQRFSIAHELGHLEMHRYDRPLLPCFSGDLNDWAARGTPSNFEQEANEFAASFLLPERFFADLCTSHDPSMKYLVQLADKFDVSLMATGRRYTQFSLEAVALVWSQDRRIRWFQSSSEFNELGAFVDVKGRLNAPTVAAEFYQKGHLSSSNKSVEASAWLREGNYVAGACLTEQSIAVPSQNGVLSLLWIDDDVYEENDEYDLML